MEQKYQEMIVALASGAQKIANVRTAEELTSSIGTSGLTGNVAGLMFKSLAISDTINGLNHLNQFLGKAQFPYDDNMKTNIIKSAIDLQTNLSTNVDLLQNFSKNGEAMDSGGRKINVEDTIHGILEDITSSAKILAR